MKEKSTQQVVAVQELNESEAILLIPISLDAATNKDKDSFVLFIKEIKHALKKYYGKDINKVVWL